MTAVTYIYVHNYSYASDEDCDECIVVGRQVIMGLSDGCTVRLNKLSVRNYGSCEISGSRSETLIIGGKPTLNIVDCPTRAVELGDHAMASISGLNTLRIEDSPYGIYLDNGSTLSISSITNFTIQRTPTTFIRVTRGSLFIFERVSGDTVVFAKSTRDAPQYGIHVSSWGSVYIGTMNFVINATQYAVYVRTGGRFAYTSTDSGFTSIATALWRTTSGGRVYTGTQTEFGKY